MGSDLKIWVSDKLMSLVGYSQSTLVQYIISLSKKAKSPADIADALKDDLSGCSAAELQAFARELFAKADRGRPAPNAYQQREREAAQLAKKQSMYTLLEDDDVDNGGVGASSSAVSESKTKDSKRKRFRKKTEVQDDEDDEVVIPRKDDRRVKRRTAQAEDDSDSEEERLRDQREREELEQNLRDRDAAGTRKLTEQKLTRKAEEEAIRRSKALEQDDMEALRKVSRQEYLKKREQKKLDEIRDDIEDEQYLFENVKLTEAEMRDLRYKKQIFDLVKKQTEEADDINEYRMPDAYDQEGGVNQEKRFSVAVERYRDLNAAEKMNPFAEQEAWEDHQIGKATMKFGSKDKKHDDYEFVFENQIEFIQDEVMKGDNYDGEPYGDSPDESVAKSAFEKLQADRKTLPVYPYREKLLEAVNEHQVLVIVEETGSGKTT